MESGTLPIVLGKSNFVIFGDEIHTLLSIPYILAKKITKDSVVPSPYPDKALLIAVYIPDASIKLLTSDCN